MISVDRSRPCGQALDRSLDEAAERATIDLAATALRPEGEFVAEEEEPVEPELATGEPAYEEAA